MALIECNKLVKCFVLARYVVSYIFFCFIFLILNYPVFATTYYVDQTNGLDNNLGTSTDQAWKTINKVNNSTFSPGDTISFKKGEIWREQLTIPSSGTADNLIVFNSYGSGNKPQIIGSSLISGWDNSDIPAGVGDLSDENFENAGYEESWVESVGAGSVVDEDSIEVTPPTGGNSQIIKIQKVSPNFNAKTERDLGSEQNITYVRFYVYVTAEGLANGQFQYLFRSYNTSLQNVTNLRLNQNSSGELRFQYDYWNNGGVTLSANYPNVAPGSGAINLNQWYKIELKYDTTNLISEFRVDDTVVGSSGTLTGSLRNPPRYFDLGNDSQSYTLTTYFDRFAVNTTGYLSEAQSLPANVWKSALANSPVVTWFTIGATTAYGISESSINNLNTQYEWFHENGYLLIYADSDPDTLYSNIEATQREGIDINGQDYITVDGFEIFYPSHWGIRTATGNTGSNSIIQNNYVHHVGVRNSSNAEGIYVRNSNTQVLSNELYEIGNHGIYVVANGVGESVVNITVSGNILHNTYHTGIDAMDIQGTLSNITIKNNHFYQESSYDTSYTSNGIYFSGTSGNIATGANIYNNVLHDISSGGISLGQYSANANVYNNTCYNTLTTYSAWSVCYIVNAISGSSYVFENNIGVNNVSHPTFYIGNSSFVSNVDYNLWFNTVGTVVQVGSSGYLSNQWPSYISDTGFESHSVGPTLPLFVDAGTNNFNLLKNSPGIDVGFDLSSLFITDYAGNSRPMGSAYDFGAYEYKPLTVTINQSIGQSDPTGISPINFTIVFSELVSDFITGDVDLSGTAGATTATVTGSGTTYNVAVSGMTSSGTVIASILADKATGATGNTNNVSTSTDNTVTYDNNSPTLTSISIGDTSGYTSDMTPNITIVSSGSPSHVAFSCDGGTNWSDWIIYADLISSFNITNGVTGCTITDGNKTISAKLKDASNNESNIVSDTTYYDTTVPNIISQTASPMIVGVTISWTTDENTSSIVDYGLTNSYGTTTSETDNITRVTSHVISLDSLVACTTYHYRIRGKDYVLNEVIGSDSIFTTSGCVGSAAINSQTSSQISTDIGGTISLINTGIGIGVDIPISFSTENANFQIKQLNKDSVISAISTPSGYSTIGNYIYDLKSLTNVSTTLTTFDSPITISISYNSSDVSGINESGLLIYRWNGSVWQQLTNCSVNINTNTVTCTTTNFSVFGLFGQTVTPTPTSAPQQSSVSSSSSSSTSNSVPSCGNSITSGVPDLFEIRSNNNVATLYFSPPPGPYTSFYISYSKKPNVFEHGVEYNQSFSSGVIKYSVSMLQPNTKYYFKIRAGNGCATGNWSNTMSIKTTNTKLQTKIYYKNIFVPIFSKVSNFVKTIVSKKPVVTPKQDDYTKPITSPTVITPNLPLPTVAQIVTTKKKWCILWWCW